MVRIHFFNVLHLHAMFSIQIFNCVRRPAAQMLVVMNDEICGTNTYTVQYTHHPSRIISISLLVHTMLQLGDDGHIFPWLRFNFN